MMDIQEAAAVLRAHQEWRKGGDGPQTDVTSLTQAIDAAVAALEAMARDGRGPMFTQAHVATSHGVHSIGKTTEDFAAAVIALEKTTRLPSVAS